MQVGAGTPAPVPVEGPPLPGPAEDMEVDARDQHALSDARCELRSALLWALILQWPVEGGCKTWSFPRADLRSALPDRIF